jgi:hypothetical protein
MKTELTVASNEAKANQRRRTASNGARELAVCFATTVGMLWLQGKEETASRSGGWSPGSLLKRQGTRRTPPRRETWARAAVAALTEREEREVGEGEELTGGPRLSVTARGGRRGSNCLAELG